MSPEPDPGRAALAELADAVPVEEAGGEAEESAAALRRAARAALDLLAFEHTRAELLDRAAEESDPQQAAAHALAAALTGIRAADAPDAIATYVGVVTGALGGVANVALADPGTGTVRHLLEQGSRAPDATREERMGELFVAGTLTRVGAHAVTLEEGLDALALVARAAEEIDALDLDALLAHVFGELGEDELEGFADRAALLGGAVTLAAVPRITGGLLSADRPVQRKGWARAAALLIALGTLAGAPMRALDAQAGAARMVADPRLLGDPATTITDLLTTVVGLQAARVLGGVGSAEPVAHLVARLLAQAALVESSA